MHWVRGVDVGLLVCDALFLELVGYASHRPPRLFPFLLMLGKLVGVERAVRDLRARVE